MAISIGAGISFGAGISLFSYPPTDQVLFDTPGTYTWTAPAGVTSVSVVCIGGGGAGTRGTSPSDSVQYRRGGDGGLYGAGGGSVGPVQQFDPDDRIGYGGNGAVRIIWGAGRSFPSNAS